MSAIPTRRHPRDESALTDLLRLGSIWVRCSDRRDAVQREVARVLIARQLSALWRGADAAAGGRVRAATGDELRYYLGEANRVLVESRTQLRLILDERRDVGAGEAPAPGGRGQRPRAAVRRRPRHEATRRAGDGRE